eukprot:g31468.t1
MYLPSPVPSKEFWNSWSYNFSNYQLPQVWGQRAFLVHPQAETPAKAQKIEVNLASALIMNDRTLPGEPSLPGGRPGQSARAPLPPQVVKAMKAGDAALKKARAMMPAVNMTPTPHLQTERRRR